MLYKPDAKLTKRVGEITRYYLERIKATTTPDGELSILEACYKAFENAGLKDKDLEFRSEFYWACKHYRFILDRIIVIKNPDITVEVRHQEGGEIGTLRKSFNSNRFVWNDALHFICGYSHLNIKEICIQIGTYKSFTLPKTEIVDEKDLYLSLKSSMLSLYYD